MFKKNNLLILIFTIFLFPSCYKHYKVSNIEFHQGQNHPDERVALNKNLKKVAIYDEYETKAIFDLLYFSDSVREAYINKHVEKKGYDQEKKNSLIAKELEQNKYWTTFYILTDLRDRKRNSLNEKNATWSVFLKLNNGSTVQPISIKEIDLEPEIQYLFGPRFTPFQRYFEVKFPAKDLNGNLYISDKTPFEVALSSAYKTSFVKFNDQTTKDLYRPYSKKRKILKNEDFYWI